MGNALDVKAMKPQSDSMELANRVMRLEEIIRVQNDLLVNLTERIGDTFAKQAFSVEDLILRWNCKETCVRNIIKSHKLKLLRGANGEPRSPIAVLRSSVLEYENGNTLIPLKKRKTKPVPTWSDNPFLSKPEFKIPSSGKGVRRLGEPICESQQVKSIALKKA